MISNNFTTRHNGPRKNDIEKMLKTIGVSSISQLINETIPKGIRTNNDLQLPNGINELEYLEHISSIAKKNKIYKSFIGMGYYASILPGVIQRNILENPGWYTAYTPYQAEISQGRLEALLNYQTMITDLTGMEISNASLLDEGTAAAEAMIMFYNSRSRASIKNGANVFFVSKELFPQSIEILKTRAVPLNIELIIGDHESFEFNDNVFGSIIQYPNQKGEIINYSKFVTSAKKHGSFIAVAADLLSLSLLSPPGEWGADVVVGSTQRFGIPMGYGGPHAAYFATKISFKRAIPGRIIGLSEDANGNNALRMALQTREQHIKRERATSNICTSQVLLAVMAGMYGVYHGPEGIKEIALDISKTACTLAEELEKCGYKQLNTNFFDTLLICLPENVIKESLRNKLEQNEINIRFYNDNSIGISIDETTSLNDLNKLLTIFANENNQDFSSINSINDKNSIANSQKRKTNFLTHNTFNSYHSETEMMRYIKRLEIKDLSLNRSMIPLGSCTMKLNAASWMFSLSWPEFGNIHPFVPENQAQGYQYLINDLEKALCEITGFSAISFQPNSGAAGEYTGLLIIRQHHICNNEGHRNITLIPSSAHGTNPASAVYAGMKVVVVKCDEDGNIDVQDMKEKAEQHKDNLACAMITYPSTHGVFGEGICTIINIIHENGGQVYLDGANMNAQVGLTNPGIIQADVCHLNLHKTFGIPHGGGGPGVGPIGVAEHLVQFLPKHLFVNTGGNKGISAVSSAAFGSAMVLPISYGYIKMLGKKGLKNATEIAILNANYIKARLEKHYKILYTGKNNHVAHEMILDCNEFKKDAGIDVIEIAKRLMDYGFHAPTVAFPVIGTLMVEPTESEPLKELDRFCDAMILIRKEIDEITEGKVDKETNVIKKAPHTVEMLTAENWEHPYTREKAGFPMPGLKEDKYWPTVTRINDAYGDRNLACTCQSYFDESTKP